MQFEKQNKDKAAKELNKMKEILHQEYEFKMKIKEDDLIKKEQDLENQFQDTTQKTMDKVLL